MRFPALVLALLLAAAVPASAEEISARAEAGLAGIARTGRWTPIVVTIENTGRAVDAVIRVTLEGERTTRAVALAAPSRKRLEFFLRAPDTDAASAQVDVTSNGRVLASTRAWLRITEGSAPFTLCIAANGVQPTRGLCTATMEPRALPTSSRAFDAVDDVVWPDGITGAILEPTQRTAYERAAAVRAFNNSTAMAPQWPTLPEPATEAGVGSRALTAYTLLLGALALFLARIARRPLRSYVVAVVVVVAGTAAVVADGRFGGSARIAESTVMRAAEGFDGTQVLVRATVLFDTPQAIDVRTSLDDPHLDGMDAIVGDRAFRGQRVSLDATGFMPTAPLVVHRHGNTIEFENRLQSALANCRLPEGFGPTTIARIHSGASVTVAVNGEVADAIVACEVERPERRFSLGAGNVTHDGRARLLLQLRAPGAAQ